VATTTRGSAARSFTLRTSAFYLICADNVLEDRA